MRILLLAATKLELDGLENPFPDQVDIDICITGVGPSFALANVFKHLYSNSGRNYHYIIQIGIVGCFDQSVPLGTVYNVTEDQFLVGAWENDTEFNSIDKMGFNQSFSNDSVLKSYLPVNLGGVLPECSGITVSCIESNPLRLKVLNTCFDMVLVESMEGAALFEVSQQFKIPAVAIKAVSNYVGERNKVNWNFNLAFQNLFSATNSVINHLNNHFNANR